MTHVHVCDEACQMMSQFYHSAGILGTEHRNVRTLVLILDGSAVWMVWLQ